MRSLIFSLLAITLIGCTADDEGHTTGEATEYERDTAVLDAARAALTVEASPPAAVTAEPRERELAVHALEPASDAAIAERRQRKAARYKAEADVLADMNREAAKRAKSGANESGQLATGEPE